LTQQELQEARREDSQADWQLGLPLHVAQAFLTTVEQALWHAMTAALGQVRSRRRDICVSFVYYEMLWDRKTQKGEGCSLSRASGFARAEAVRPSIVRTKEVFIVKDIWWLAVESE
jgi:hypothetical protein